MNRILLFPLLCIITAFSCTKPERPVLVNSSPEYFAFGKAYGMCGGDCATFYAIDNGKAYPDNMNHLLYDKGLSFSTNALPDATYEKIKELYDKLPQYLKDNTNKTFGCPDCHDQGTIYIEARVNDQKVYWSVDTDTDGQPEDIKEFIVQLSDVFNQL